VGGLVCNVGGSNRDVGGSDRSVGGRDRGVGGRVVDFVFRRRFAFSVADDGWDEANGDRTDRAMEQRAAANLERSVPAAVGVLESGFRVFESSTWRPTGSTSSPWADKKSKPRMSLCTAARDSIYINMDFIFNIVDFIYNMWILSIIIWILYAIICVLCILYTIRIHNKMDFINNSLVFKYNMDLI
jgi:hypothetical protein